MYTYSSIFLNPSSEHLQGPVVCVVARVQGLVVRAQGLVVAQGMGRRVLNAPENRLDREGSAGLQVGGGSHDHNERGKHPFLGEGVGRKILRHLVTGSVESLKITGSSPSLSW